MFRKPKFIVFCLFPCLITSISLLRIFQVDNLEEKKRSSRILLINFKGCRDIYQINKDYGEGTSLVRHSNGKTYLLSLLEHCPDFFTL